MKYITSEDKPSCIPGWPQEVGGYPHCEMTPSQIKFPNLPVIPDIFTYCSPPTAVMMKEISGIQRRANYRNNVPKPRGVHSYYNVMWDGRVRRGDPAKRSIRREEEECEKIRSRLNQPRVGKTFSQLKEEAKAAAVAESTNALLNTSSSAPMTSNQSELLRYSQLAISNLCPRDPEKYLVDLSDEIDNDDTCYKGKRLQILRSFPIAPSKKPNLHDAGTQVFPGEFFDFQSEAQPILEKFVGAVVEQAHIEILEEEEVAAYRLQKERLKNKIVDTAKNIETLKGREGKRDAELDRVRKAEHESRTGLNETQKFYQTCAAAGNLNKDAITECVEALKREAALAKGQHAPVIQDGIISWINDEVSEELKQQHISRNFLDALIIDVVNKREAEYAEAIWREVYAEDPIKKYGDHDGFVPPTTPDTSWAEGQSSVENIPGTSEYFNEDSDEF